mmetsp:Transcript_3924/g.7960  ORF Transcript_3924/g.7960 Transcript_3924/m.7960 type:complete len:252 (-) Transcript_3924:49-804(-)|eukprot:CAMPEP_0172725014 /NCGR_PEP_ID=MMETSP1074-20121228/87381_1 /TAXON_ID=2916 /ORGANISM="Ceratium fusus, Strain PA161109" /LENGTH=251 /DNA_ID=CAMNT_0013551679 /DNA_START=64 /DNA_END=819 /DNA_ORIENTATION=+
MTRQRAGKTQQTWRFAALLFAFTASNAFRRQAGQIKPANRIAFFDFFGNPSIEQQQQESEEAANSGPKMATSGQMKAQRLLRSQLRDAQLRWAELCDAANHSADSSVLPADFVQDFVLDPNNHKNDFLNGFLKRARLDPVQVPNDVDEEEEEFGGFMDSNRFGLIKSEAWKKAEKKLLVARISENLPERRDSWEQYCIQIESWDDPDDEESQAVRNEMGMRSEIGRKKTALESWNEAQAGRVPRDQNKWGV